MKDESIVCLMGPTASGKTDLALQLVERFPFEIISVDSAMIYRGMDIGTAKPSPSLLRKYPHHLIDIRDPIESYSVAEFCSEALEAIEMIRLKGKKPLLVGGTMMYFKSLQQGLSILPSANQTIRQQLTAEAKEKGWPVLHQRLREIDPVSAKRIHSNDAQRIQRALEVFQITEKTLTDLHYLDQENVSGYSFINIAIIPEDRQLLHKRIEKRFQSMLKEGLIEEVEVLYQRGDLNEALPSIRAVGYRQVWQYLKGEIDQKEMEEKGMAATRQLAKRQLTWLRSWSELHHSSSGCDKSFSSFLSQLFSA